MPYLGPKPVNVRSASSLIVDGNLTAGQVNSDGAVIATGAGTFSGDLTVDTNTLFVDASANRVGIGTSSPQQLLHVSANNPGGKIRLEMEQTGVANGDVTGEIQFYHNDASGAGVNADIKGICTSSIGAGSLTFGTGTTSTTERMRIDSSGNVLVGKTSSDINIAGLALFGEGVLRSSRTSGEPLQLNRISTDGDIVSFRKDGSTVGSIGTASGNPFFATASGTVKTGLLMVGGSVPRVLPCNNTGSVLDNSVDLGQSSSRYDDIFATNGTIQTSDRNEKQDIEALTDAEQRVAVAAKGLMRKFRWKDAYALKGDDARIHFGIIAQDLQDAFTAEGLDAGRYAMFIYSEWWETTETYTDDDGVEQTRTNTYDSEDEAPDGAVKKSRMGVRYSELLAFIIAAI